MTLVVVLLALACLRGYAEGALTSVATGDCVCATTTADARDSPGLSSTVIDVLHNSSDCGKIFGGILTRDGYKWYELNYKGLRLWVAGNYLSPAESSSKCTSGVAVQVGCPGVVPRTGWGARKAVTVHYHVHPVKYVFIHHSGGEECHSKAACTEVVKRMQNHNMDDQGWADIAYTYVIGGDGSVFEGRGWEHIGSHTFGYNAAGFGFCLLGNFTTKAPPKAQLDAAKRLMFCGVNKRKMSNDYIVRGHRDVGNTDCPGDKLYAEIKTWSHY